MSCFGLCRQYLGEMPRTCREEELEARDAPSWEDSISREMNDCACLMFSRRIIFYASTLWSVVIVSFVDLIALRRHSARQ